MTSAARGDFDWDADNIAHVGRHRVSPEEFEQVILNSPISGTVRIDAESGEERQTEMGHTDGGRVLFACWTMRQERMRPVTAWPVNRKQREQYYRNQGMTL